MKNMRSLLILGLAATALSACTSLKEDLGLGRNPPDEFAVVDRPPLSMPPDFGLRPPVPGAPRPQEIDTSKRAEESLMGSKDALNTDKPSGVEKALLEQANAENASADIRETINRESAEKVVASEHLVQRLLWWQKGETSSSPTVDAAAEAARIKEAKDKGEPLNAGATPIIERQKSGWLGL